jgi:lysophospholipase L1-like esterase
MADAAPTVGVLSFAALGDSFTAGTGCPPGSGWADRLAASLRRRNGGLAYRNLAREGATSAGVQREQLPAALEMEPDLVSVICGANDVLHSVRPDLDGFAGRLALIFDRLIDASSPTLITATVPEQWRFLELGPRTTRRVSAGIARVNEEIRRVAAEREVPCLDVVGHPGLDDRRNFSPDGLHPSPAGHARAADEFGRLLGGMP